MSRRQAVRHRARASDDRPGRQRRPGRRHRPARWSLRARLLAALIALLAGVSIVISLISVVALHRFLYDRLDSQLTFAFTRSRSAADAPGPDTGDRRPVPEGIGVLTRPSGRGPAAPGPFFLLAPGQSEGTIGVEAGRDGNVEAAVLDSAGSLRQLTATQSRLLLAVPRDDSPHTVDLGGDLGPYRVVAATGDRGVLITGLPLNDVQAITVRLAGIVSAVSVVGLIVAGAAGALIVRLSLRPLRRVAATATRVTRLPLDRGQVSLAERVPDADTSRRTEVGQVGAALNRLLGHVEDALAVRHASEERVRRFVADASHELRTPLAAIRGYAELTRRGGHHLPPDVAHAVRRVEAEAVRMTDLVEDLLLLARLDEGRPLAREPVDLSALLVDAVSDAHAASPAHRWQLRIPDEPLVVVGDPARLYQVFGNLLGNARVHTPQGTDVVVSLRAEQRAAVVEVVDGGPGIPPALLPEVFERFARGDSSRSRAAGSTGLGLSIVSAVVTSHEGEVSVTSRPGQTAFQVRLPLAGAPAGAAARPPGERVVATRSPGERAVATRS